MKKFNIYILLLLTVVTFSACDDYLDIKPTDRLIPTTAKDFRDLLSSAYNGVPADKARLTFRTDELKLDNNAWDLTQVQDIYLWKDVNNASNTLHFSYQSFYKVIMYTNHIINVGVNATEGTTEEINQIVGEAYLLRAYMHFSLVNQYGKPYNAATAEVDKGIPISLVIDTEAKYSPSSVAEVYSQIKKDITKALDLVNVEVYGKGLNYRFSKLAALAFQSRVYLYMNDFENANITALEALKLKSDLKDLVADNSSSAHKFDSNESILALEDVFSYEVRSSSFISDKMKNAFDQVNDLRFALYFIADKSDASKFAVNKGTDAASKCTFRTSELYLTIAECNAKLDNLNTSKNYLNQLKAKRLTADYYNLEVTRVENLNRADLITEIAAERFREFAFEGHRWFDLRRTTQETFEHVYRKESAILLQGDPRYTLRFPQEAVDNNPNLKN